MNKIKDPVKLGLMDNLDSLIKENCKTTNTLNQLYTLQDEILESIEKLKSKESKLDYEIEDINIMLARL